MVRTPPSKSPRILIMAGGTGGHIFPGLALAQHLQTKHFDIHWLGTARGIENEVVPEANIPLHLISIGGLRGKGMASLVKAPFKISHATWQAIQLIRKIKPDLVFGLGGFVSGPGGLAAWLTRTPLIIHEQNAKAGLTNRLLSKLANYTLQGFPSAFDVNEKVITVGNPVRASIENLTPPVERIPHAKFSLLILGGSLGAQLLNTVIPNYLNTLASDARPQVLHQTGAKLYEETLNLYKKNNISLTDGKITVVPFIKNMAEAYSQADMVLCRAGALTVAELCAAGLGAIFVPYPYAVDDHQTANADFMVKEQAAVCIQQSELTTDYFSSILNDFMLSKEKCLHMALAAYKLRKIQVVEQIYQLIVKVLN